MNIKTERLKAFTVVGIARRQSNDKPERIEKLWQDFFAGGGIKQIPNRKSDDIFAVYTEYAGDHTKPYTMLIGCEVDELETLPEALDAKTVPAGQYAVFNAKGPQPASVVSAWQHIYRTPLDRTYVADFDRYRSAEDVEVHVGVR